MILGHSVTGSQSVQYFNYTAAAFAVIIIIIITIIIINRFV